jgi:hypothetical protein
VKERDGILFATSEEEPTFFVSAPSADVLLGIVECALADLFRQVYKRDVVVVQSDKGNFQHKEMIILDRQRIAGFAVCSAAA